MCAQLASAAPTSQHFRHAQRASTQMMVISSALTALLEWHAPTRNPLRPRSTARLLKDSTMMLLSKTNARSVQLDQSVRETKHSRFNVLMANILPWDLLYARIVLRVINVPQKL